MPRSSLESLLEERFAQLEAITYRRNELLQQMYHMMRRRHAAGSVLTVDEHDEDLPAFLERFDLNKHPEIGTISNLDDQELELGLSGETETLPMSPSQEHKEPSPNAGLNFRAPLMQTDTNVNTESELEDTSSITIDPSPRPRSPTPLASISVKMDDELDLVTPFQIAQPYTPLIVSEISPPHSPQPIQNAANAAEEDHRARSFDVDLGQQDDCLKQPTSQLHEDSIRSATPPSKMDVGKSTQDVVVQGAQENEGLCASQTNQSVEAGQLPNFLEPVFEGEPRAYVQVQAQARPEYLALESSKDSPAIGVSTPRPLLPSPTPEPEATPRLSITIPFPLPSTGQNFIFTSDPTFDPHSTPPVPVQPRHQFDPHYTLPPLKILPPEFNRKSKLLKLQRKREKERERGDAKKDRDSNKEEWRPIGVSRWAATINANPVWKKVSRASKCITTREWGVAMSELKLVRTLDRIESLKVGGRWSFRQPRKQRGIGALVKSHWDHLMDEMKWMRIDFREERRWKMALAYNLSTAVLEWHAAGSQAPRLEKGITVHWRPPNLEEMDIDEPAMREEQTTDGTNADQIQTTPDQARSSLLGIDYGSDEDDEDKDSQDIVDGLEPSTLIQDILESSADQDAEGDGINDVQLKTEDMDDSAALRTAMETVTLSPKDSTTPDNEPGHLVITNALKQNSDDPLLGSKSTSQSSVGDAEPVVSTRTSTKISAYGPFREQVAYSEDQRLFFDVHDLDPRQTRTKGSTVDEILSLPPDLTSIFPDLQPFGLLDPTPVIGLAPATATEGKKKSEKRPDRDDPTKRAEDTTYTKLYPIGRFMHSKPTLLGALQPAKRWKDGSWIPLEEPGVAIETDGPAKFTDDNVNDLFDSRSSNSPAAIMAMHMQAAHMLKDKDRRRGADHLWSTNDDALLKSLIDKYSTNWLLISECFNASRVTIPTDKRTTRDCLERWKEKWGPDIRAKPSDVAVEETPTPPALSTQMTTRGVKRLASSSVSGPGSASGSEPRKRRRHMLIQDAMRKAAKKRAEVAQKFSANQRKPPAIHETHVQYNKMQKFTPAELSRMKTDKESRDIAMARQLRHPHVPVPALIPQTNGLPRGTPVGVSLAPGASQLRSQVNISQQQRITAPASTSSGTSRLSPQQIAQVQAQAQAQRVAQSNQQVAAQASTAGPTINGSTSAGSHVQSNFNRDTAPSPAHATTINSPRPPSAQAQINIAQAQVATNVPRPSNGHYFLPNPSNMQNFTPEQLHTALRLQMLQQQQQQQQLQLQQQQQQ